jgi:hypothetical protein
LIVPIKNPSVAERFSRDVASHQIEIIKDDGLHRHIRLAQPGTGVMRFDLITWPGHLCYTGDMGSYLFSRLTDMFNFFRGRRPNLSYWGEKVLASDRISGISRYSSDVFENQIKQYFEDCTCDWEEDRKKTAWLKVAERVLPHSCQGQYAAMEAAALLPVFADFWEIDCSQYDFPYEWCCHAIPWGIAQYDKLKELQLTPPPAAPPPPQ